MPRRGRRPRGACKLFHTTSRLQQFTINAVFRGHRRGTGIGRGAPQARQPPIASETQHEERVSSRSSSETGSDVRLMPLTAATALIGGRDFDSDRPSKLARISSYRDRSPSPQVSRQATTKSNDKQIKRKGSMASSHSNDELAVNNNAVVGASENEDDVSEAAKETVEYPGPGTATGEASPVRIKRPKGWHLRKENRHLRRAILQGSPIRSERQDSIDTQEASGYEPAAILKRLPGRRRAPHADPDIEADMRRQLELKIGYRAVVKALKPLLIELAQRTEDNLENDQSAHEEFEEYDHIRGIIDSKLAERLAIIKCEFVEKEAHLKRIHEAEVSAAQNQSSLLIDDYRDNALIHCKQLYMKTLRNAQIDEDSDATEHENDIISCPSVQGLEMGEKKFPDVRYHSRCYAHLETESIWNDLHNRQEFLNSQRESDPLSLEARPKGFAVYDGELRASSNAALNMLSLLDADAELERRKAVADRRASNSAATGLQALVTAINMVPFSQIPQPEQKVEFVSPANPLSNESGASHTLYPAHDYPQETSRPVQPASQAFEAGQLTKRNPPSDGLGRESLTSYSDSGPQARVTPEQFVQTNDPHHLARYNVAHPQAPSYPQNVPTSGYTIPPSASQYISEPPVRFEAIPAPQAEPRSQRKGKAPTFDIIMHQPPESSGPAANARLSTDSESQEYTRSSDDSQREPKQRDKKRPGPKAIYTSTNLSGTKTAPSILQPPAHLAPFNNNMGPPMAYAPSYIKETGYPPHPLGDANVRDSNVLPSTLSGPYQDSRPTSYEPLAKSKQDSAPEQASYQPYATHTSTPRSYYERGFAPAGKISPQPPPSLDTSSTYRQMRSYPNTPASATQTQPRTGPGPGQPTWSTERVHAVSDSQQPLSMLTRPLSPRLRESRPTQSQQPVPDTGVRPHTFNIQYPPTLESGGKRQSQSPLPGGSQANPQQAYPEPYSYIPKGYAPYDSQYHAEHDQRNPPIQGQLAAHERYDPASQSKPQPQYPATSTYTTSRPPSSQGPPEPNLTQSMQRHPGQRIGQQLLPATLDPARTGDPTRVTSATSKPHGPYHHHKHRSSSGSARSWQVPSAYHPHDSPGQYPSSHHRSRSSQYELPRIHKPPAPSTPDVHREGIERWPGFERREFGSSAPVQAPQHQHQHHHPHHSHHSQHQQHAPPPPPPGPPPPQAPVGPTYPAQAVGQKYGEHAAYAPYTASADAVSSRRSSGGRRRRTSGGKGSRRRTGSSL